MFGPAATTWYGFLARRVGAGPRWGRWGRAGLHVAADQAAFAPAMIAVFLSSMAALEGEPAQARLQAAYLPALRANWAVWPAAQALNFALVPPQFRVLVVNLVSVGWNCYLSFLNSRPMGGRAGVERLE